MQITDLNRILIADDHALFRQGLKLVLEKIATDSTVFEAASIDEARHLAQQEGDFDIVLLDLSMPGMDVGDGLKSFCCELEPCPVVILSGFHEKDDVTAAIAAGARGYLLKSFSEDTLRLALELILAGEVYLPSIILGQQQSVSPSRMPILSPETGFAGSSLEVLTPRQRDVLMLVMEGKSNKVIARELGVLESTVKAHIQVILQKLNAENRTHAAMIAREILQTTGADARVF